MHDKTSSKKKNATLRFDVNSNQNLNINDRIGTDIYLSIKSSKEPDNR